MPVPDVRPFEQTRFPWSVASLVRDSICDWAFRAVYHTEKLDHHQPTTKEGTLDLPQAQDVLYLRRRQRRLQQRLRFAANIPFAVRQQRASPLGHTQYNDDRHFQW